jgi:hypothetical protein
VNLTMTIGVSQPPVEERIAAPMHPPVKVVHVPAFLHCQPLTANWAFPSLLLPQKVRRLPSR